MSKWYGTSRGFSATVERFVLLNLNNLCNAYKKELSLSQCKLSLLSTILYNAAVIFQLTGTETRTENKSCQLTKTRIKN